MKIMAIAVVAILIGASLAGLYLTGNLPGLSLLDNGTTTKIIVKSGIHQVNGHEIIGPRNRNAFICAYISTEYSEDIVAQGTIMKDLGSIDNIDKVKYIVSLKRDAVSPYQIVSQPGTTDASITNANPGEIPVSMGFAGQQYVTPRYDFMIKGPAYSNGAIKVELWGHISANLQTSWGWYLIGSDEAYLYSGWGGLYLPMNGSHYQSTFEIGEHVKIQVKTSYGAVTDNNGTLNTWRVTLQRPMSQGGTVYKTMDYTNNVNTWFEFDVTSDMFSLGGDNTWTLQIYNVLVPKGTMNIYTIDLKAKAPSIVTFSGAPSDNECKVGTQVTMRLSAAVNAQTQLPISKFKVCIIYGSYDVLLPSDPLDQLWILPWTDVTRISGNTATVTFTPKHESWVTIHAVAVDSEGRTSITENTYTLWVYNQVPASQDQMGDTDGSHEYGGGSTNSGFWFPPGTTDQMQNWIGFILKIIITIVILIIAILAAVFIPVPIWIKAVIILVGIAIAVAYFLWAPLISI